jgi:hypothetical protein
VKHLRLAKVKTLKDANKFLEEEYFRLQLDDRSSVETAMATRRIDYRSELWCRFERFFSEELKACGFEDVITAMDLLL